MARGGWSSEEKREILEYVKEQCRNEGRRDALVNLKKYILETPGRLPRYAPHMIARIDGFMIRTGLVEKETD